MAAIETLRPIPWWREPTKDQWLAWVAAWLGWTLDAFDFTIFLATASAFCYHLRTIFGGLVPPVITYFAVNYHLSFSVPMLIGCVIGSVSWCLALFLGPETKGKDMVPDLVLA